MYDVVVYFSSLPRIADHDRKVQILRAFSDGCKKIGLRVLDQTKLEVADCKLAVMIGWVGQTFKGPHIHLRNDVINHQRATGRHGLRHHARSPNRHGALEVHSTG